MDICINLVAHICLAALLVFGYQLLIFGHCSYLRSHCLYFAIAHIWPLAIFGSCSYFAIAHIKILRVTQIWPLLIFCICSYLVIARNQHLIVFCHWSYSAFTHIWQHLSVGDLFTNDLWITSNVTLIDGLQVQYLHCTRISDMLKITNKHKQHNIAHIWNFSICNLFITVGTLAC